MDLNVIRIPIGWWAPTAQRTHKQPKRASTSRYWFKSILYRAFPLLFLFNTNPVYYAPITYSLPGMNHVLIQEASLDLSRQRNIERTVIENTVRPHLPAPSLPVENGSPTNCFYREEKCNSALGNSATGNPAIGNSAIVNSATSNPATDILQTPHSFIADTDSIEIFLDTGANRVVVNNKTLLTNFIPTNDKFKVIVENPTTVVGTGTFNISLQSNNGIYDKFFAKKAIYVPTSPYNIIPPQLLLQIMKEKVCVAHMSQVGGPL